MKRNLRGILGMCGLLSVALPAAAADYYMMINASTKSHAIFADAATVVKKNGLTAVWIKAVLDPTAYPIGHWRSNHTRWSINCQERTMRVLQSINYGTDGKVMGSSGADKGGGDEVAPESTGEHLLNALCQPKFPSANDDSYMRSPDIEAMAARYFSFYKQPPAKP